MAIHNSARSGWLFLMSLFCVGFSSLAGQVAGVRAVLSISGGGEIVMSIALAIWLFGHFIGNIAGISLIKLMSAFKVYVGSFIFLSVSAPLAIILLFIMKQPVGLVTGEIAGVVDTIVFSLIVILPITIPLGVSFASASSPDVRRGIRISYLYAFEAFGSIAGGLIAYIAVPEFLNTLSLAVVASVVSLLAVVFLFGYLRGRTRIIVPVVVVLIVLFLITSTFSGSVMSLYEYVRGSYTVPGYKILLIEATPYGEIVLIEREGERAILLNGCIIASNAYTDVVEETALLPLALSGSYSRILLIGDGLSGELEVLNEIEGVSKVVVPIMSGAVVEMVDENLNTIPTDDRIKIKICDPRKYIEASDKRFDLIVNASPPPTTVEENRLFTVECMRAVRDALDDDGVFVLITEGDEQYIGDALAEYLKSIKLTIGEVFERVNYIPGSRVIFVARDSGEGFDIEPNALWKRIEALSVKPMYITMEGLYYRLLDSRVDMLEEAMDIASGDVNYDYQSIAYYHDLTYLASYTDPVLSQFLSRIKYHHPGMILLIVLFALIASSVLTRKRAVAPTILIVIMGSLSIMLEILLIVVYQSVVGGLYRQIAVIFAIFMAGLAVGSIVSGWKLTKGRGERILLGAYLLTGLLIMSLSILVSRISGIPVAVFSLVIIALTAMCSGLLFGFASDRLSGRGSWVGGLFHGSETLGSTLSSFITALIILPLIGLKVALLMLGLAFISIGIVIVIIMWR